MLKRYICIYFEYIRINLIRISHNKRESIIGGLSWFVLQTCGLISSLVIIEKAGNIEGWTLYEIGLLYAGMTFSRAFSMILFDGFWNISYIVRFGELDQFLVRPISPLFQIVTYRLEMSGIGNLIFSIITFAFCFTRLQLNVPYMQYVVLYIYLICGSLILSALFLLFNSFAFWIIDGHDIATLLLNLFDFTKFPISIFPKFLQFILVWIIPLAYVNYYPVGIFLGKEVSLTAKIVPFIFCIISWGSAWLIWRLGIRNYSSTGN